MDDALPALEAALDRTHAGRSRPRRDHHTLDLWNLGVALDDVAWTRLPGG